MNHATRIASRFVLIVTLTPLASALISASGPTWSPYLSALSIAAPGPALAAGHCNNRVCGPSFKCEPGTGFNCTGRCLTHQCF